MLISTPHGDVEVTVDEQPMTTGLTTAGTLNLPAGDWRVVQAASDTAGGQSTTRTQIVAGPAALALTNLRHLSYRGAAAGSISMTLVVQKNNGSAYVNDSGGSIAPVVLPARPAPSATLIGSHLYPVMFGTYAIRDITGELASVSPNQNVQRLGLVQTVLQPTSSAWDPTYVAHLDDVFAKLAAAGCAVSLTVGGTPAWARVGGTVASPPTDPATHTAAWVDSIITRWGGVVDIIGIDPWNEPNNNPPNAYSGTDAQMVAIIRAAKAGAAGRCPVYTPAGCTQYYLASLIAAGLTDADFDGVDVHPYPIGFGPPPTYPTPPHWIDPRYSSNAEPDERYGTLLGSIHEMQRILNANAMSAKTFLVSEVGVSVNPRDPSPGLRMDDPTSAAWTTVQLDQCKRHPDVVGVCVHETANITGAAPGSSWNAAWGLVRPDGSRRAKWYSVAAA